MFIGNRKDLAVLFVLTLMSAKTGYKNAAKMKNVTIKMEVVLKYYINEQNKKL